MLDHLEVNDNSFLLRARQVATEIVRCERDARLTAMEPPLGCGGEAEIRASLEHYARISARQPRHTVRLLQAWRDFLHDIARGEHAVGAIPIFRMYEMAAQKRCRSQSPSKVH